MAVTGPGTVGQYRDSDRDSETDTVTETDSETETRTEPERLNLEHEKKLNVFLRALV